MTEELSKILAQKLDQESVKGEILNLEPLTGGASKEIWKFELRSADSSQTVSYTHLRAHET